MSDSDLNGLIQQNGWLRDLLSSIPNELKKALEVRRYQPKQVIYKQEEEATHFFILVSGELVVEYATAEGQVFMLAILGPGEILGDLEMALQRPLLCNVSVKSKAVMLAMKKELYLQWIMQDPRFLSYINVQLANKLYQTSRKTIENKYMSLRKRLLRYLLGLVKDFDFNEQVAFTASLSREELALKLGVTVRSVNRVIKELKERRMIFVYKSDIILNEYSRYMIERELQKDE